MKKIALYMMLLLLVACQNEDEGASRVTIQSHSIKSVIENNYRSTDESRTSVDEEGHVSWIESDRLGVFGTITLNACFTSSGTGTEVDFTGELSEGDKEIVCVYYPYDEDATFDNNSLTFTLPDGYTYTGNSHAPMLGVEQEDGSYLFKHLCGLMRVTVKGVPEGTSTFKVTSVGENALGIAGKARVADITSTDAVLSLEDEVSKTVTVTLEAEEIMDATFYIPLPIGTYSQLAVTYSDDSKEYFTKTTSNVTIERGMLLDMPVLTALDDDAVVDDYLDKIDVYIQTIAEESYSSIKEKLVQWLNEQDYVEKLELMESQNQDEYGITFTNGKECNIGFIYGDYSGEESRSTDAGIKEFYVPFEEGERILENRKVKSFSFLYVFDHYYEESEKTLKKMVDESPVELEWQTPLQNRDNAVAELENCNQVGVVLFTDTHGAGGGSFRVSNENLSYLKGLNLSYNKSRLYWKEFKNYKVFPCLALKPYFFHDKNLLQGISILYGSYCWSNGQYKIDNFDYSLYRLNSTRPVGERTAYLGYSTSCHSSLNYKNVGYFFEALLNGNTVENAYEHEQELQQTYYDEEANCEAGDLKYNNVNSNLRYFSISTNEIAENNTLTGTINGYKNLKESIKYYIYYQEGTEEFTPDKVTDKYKREIKPNDSGAIEYAFTDLESGKTYTYAIGFEYNSKYYYGDLKQFVFAEPVQTVDECTVESFNATCSGYVYAEIDDIEEYGICYSATATEPSINDKGGELIIALNENKMFSVTLSNLESKTKYYYRAYAKFKGQDEPKYGEVKTFETEEVDVVNTAAVSDITHLSATASGYVYEEEDAIAEYGICYSASETPSIVIGETIKATELDEQGKFSVALDCLEPDATYYYCAYAVINGEPVYGEIKSFKTQEAPLTPGTAIDLGLPSGTKWASHNLGASSPEGYGGLYGWGDPTGEHTEPMLNNSGYIDKNLIYYGGLEDAPLTISGGKLDVAKAKWGGRWRLPTKDEILELINNCTHEYVVVGNTPGVKFVGINGNSIFLPFAGMRTLKGGDRKHDVESGYYWSGTRWETGTNPWRAANSLSISYSGYLDIGLWSCGRAGGLSVRPVR